MLSFYDIFSNRKAADFDQSIVSVPGTRENTVEPLIVTHTSRTR